MNIVVCVKQVPDTAEIKIDAATKTLQRDGVKSIINPDDRAGLEVALGLKDAHGGTVTVLCMGPLQAKRALYEALAMGADKAVLLTDREFAGSDTFATSNIISSAIKKMEYDLIVAGRQAIDGDTAQVGPQIAEMLDLPQITYVTQIDYDKDKKIFTVRQKLEDRVRIYEAASPLLITVLSGQIKPRYMNVRLLNQLKEDRIEEWTVNDIEVNRNHIGLSGSPTKVKSVNNKDVGGPKDLIEAEPEEAVRIIMEKLKERGIGGF